MRFDLWGLQNATVEPISGGYNSLAWLVEAGGGRYVAKQVGGDRAAFEAGLLVAELLEESGFRAGRPVRTTTGELTVPHEDEWLALLGYVPGEPVTPETDEGLATWGRAMGRIHTLLTGVTPPAALPRTAVVGTPETPAVAGAEWVGPAVATATEEVQRLTDLTEGIFHGDGCEPRRDAATGEVAVIDWGAAGYGPLLTDVGVARWYFQSYHHRQPEEFAPFLDAYLAEAPITLAELHHLDAFVRLRAAMSGWYFAWRLDQEYTVGADSEWNLSGMEQARRLWESLSR